MKSFLTYSILLTGLFLSACTSEDVLSSSNEVKEVSATLIPFQDGESLTRTEYSISEQSGFQTLWATGDILGIYPIGGDQVSFPISDGVGTTSAKFDGGSWALRGTYKYAAYYPFSTAFYTTDQTAIPVDFTGQTQIGNNTTAHLAAVDFMAAAGTQPSSNGSVNLSFNHVGCFLRMQFTMPVAGTFTSVEIQTDGGTFTTKGTVNLAATTPALTPTATTTKLTLGLTNVSTTSANQAITLYMMVAPGNLSSQTLTFTVKDSNGNSYTKTAAGKNMLATYAYNYALTLESTGTGGNTGGGSWGTNTHNGHEYVDLGITINGQKILWATCNVGATTPEGYGDYFAWGATSPQSVYDWVNTPYQTQNTTSYEFAMFTKYLGSTTSYFKDSSAKDSDALKTVLDPEDDAASVNWGGSWRMPTKAEQDALRDTNNCTWTWTTQNSVEGCKVTSKINGNSLFLPAAGFRYDSNLKNAGSDGYYWSSSLNASRSDNAIFLKGSDVETLYLRSRRYGHSIRPVFVISE